MIADGVVRIARPPQGLDFNDLLLHHSPHIREATMSTLDTGGNDDPICAALNAAVEVLDLVDSLAEWTVAGPGTALVSTTHPFRSGSQILRIPRGEAWPLSSSGSK